MDFLNRIDPELKKGVTLLPSIHLPDDLEEARQISPSTAKHSEAVKVTEHCIANADAKCMRIKIYEPATRDGMMLPALLWIHGGGYVAGHPDNDDRICEDFVEAANCVVVSPDYRLAPEHPFPAAIEDCYAALVWLTDETNVWNVDHSRIAIAGASAGGGLTAALALMARDKGGPSICFQMPLYPMIDDRCMTPSSHEITDSRVWNRSNNMAAWKMYLGGQCDDDIPSYAAPIRAESLAHLPPVYTFVGQLDPFRDETIEYVRRLAEAGVDVEFHIYPGCYHAFEHIVPDARVSQQARRGYLNALSRAFRRQSG